MTRLILLFALSAPTFAQDAVTPLGGGLYRVEFWAHVDDQYLGPDGQVVLPDSVYVAVVYGAESAVDPEVTVTVKAERDSLRYQYRVGNGLDGPRPIRRFELFAEAYASDRRAPDEEWRTGRFTRWDEGKPYDSTHYTWSQTGTFNAPWSPLRPNTLQPGVALDGFSLLSAGLPAVVDARARAPRHLVPEDTTAAPFRRWSVAQVRDHAWTPNLDRLRDATEYATFRTLGPRAVPDPFDGPAFLDTLAADIAEGDRLGWFGPHGPRVAGLLAEGRVAWAAGDRLRTADALRAADAVAADEAVSSEGRALVQYNVAFALERLSASDGDR